MMRTSVFVFGGCEICHPAVSGVMLANMAGNPVDIIDIFFEHPKTAFLKAIYGNDKREWTVPTLTCDKKVAKKLFDSTISGWGERVVIFPGDAKPSWLSGILNRLNRRN